jgi:hypothetical protein
MPPSNQLQKSDISRFLGFKRGRTDRILSEFKGQAGVTDISEDHVPILQQALELSEGDMTLRDAVARAMSENGGECRDRHAAWVTHYKWFRREYERNNKVQLTPVWTALAVYLQIEEYITADRFKDLAEKIITDFRAGKKVDELEQNAAMESVQFKQTDAYATDYASALLEAQTPPPDSLDNLGQGASTTQDSPNSSGQEAPTIRELPTNSDRNEGGSHRMHKKATSYSDMVDHQNTTAILTLRIFNGLLARPSRGLLSKETYLLSRNDQNQIMAFGSHDDEAGADKFSRAVDTFRERIIQAIKEGQVPLVGGLDNLHFIDQVENFSSPDFSEDQRLIVEAASSFDDVTARVLMNMGAEAELFLIHLAPWHLVHQMIVPAFIERGSVSGLWVLKNIHEFVHTVSRQLTESGLNFETMKRINRTVTSYGRGGELALSPSAELGARARDKTLPSEVPIEESPTFAESLVAVDDWSVSPVAQAPTMPVSETVEATSDSSAVASPSVEYGDPFADQRTPETEADFFLSEHHPADLVLAETPTSTEAPSSLQSLVGEVQEPVAVETVEDHMTAPTADELPLAFTGWRMYDSSTAEETPPVLDDQGLLTPGPSTWLHDHVPALAKTITSEVEHPTTEPQVGPEVSGSESSTALFPETIHDSGETAPIVEPASAHSAHDVALSSVPLSLETIHDSGEGTPIMEPVLSDPAHDVAPSSTPLFQETTQDAGVSTPIVEPVLADSAHDHVFSSPPLADHSVADTEVSPVSTHADVESVLVQSSESVAPESEVPVPEVSAPAQENSVSAPEVQPAAQVTTAPTHFADDSEMPELPPLTVSEITTLVHDLYEGTRPILSGLDPSSLEDGTLRRQIYGQLFDLYREYMLLESEPNLAHLDQPQTEAYNRLGVRFRENLLELKP